MSLRPWVVLLGLAMAMPVVAQDGDAGRGAARADAWLGSDSEGNQTRKLTLGWDVAHRDQDHWWGLKVERVHFSGDRWSESEDRAYVSGAGGGPDWSWDGDIGSNGHDLIGRGTIHSRDARRKEFFIERDVLETRKGTANGWVQTFAGAAIDLPMGERWNASLLAGVQDFDTGDNLRTHLRMNLVHVLVPEQGVSLQLRTRYFHNSDPREADYFSPPWHGEALGVLGWRRFVGGYRWQASAGAGRQRSAGGDWKRARMLQVGLETPRWHNAWLRFDAGYSDTPVAASTGTDSYAYRFARVQAAIAF